MTKPKDDPWLSADERLLHYWWYMYLRRNIEYGECCKNGGKGPHKWLYKWFGDVHSHSYSEWWNERLRIRNFEYRHDAFVVPHYTMQAVLTIEDAEEWIHNEDGVLLGVNLWAPEEQLRNAFEEMMRKFRTSAFKLRDTDAPRPEFPLNCRATRLITQKLKRGLISYNLQHDQRGSDLPQWHIYYLSRGQSVPSVKASQAEREEMAASVFADVRDAELAIAGTLLGVFPATVTTPPHPRYPGL